jgi:hypothetical protein
MGRVLPVFTVLAVGLILAAGLIDWTLQNRGPDEASALGLFLGIVSVPLLLVYAFARDGR